MKKILPFVLLLAATFPFYAQRGKVVGGGNSRDSKTRRATERCKLTLDELPLFHQVKSGMSYEEVAEIYPEIKTDKFFQSKYAEGQSGHFMLVSLEYPDRPYSAEFDQISLGFSEGRLTAPAAVVYNPEKWASIDDAISYLSGVLGLNVPNWTVYYEDSAKAVCGDFTVYASSQGAVEHRQNSMSIHPKKK